MMGDGTEEQNLDERQLAARIEKDELDAAFKPKAKEVANHVSHFEGWARERLCYGVGRGALRRVSRRLRFNLWLIV
jgi:hypothetical protein